MADTLNNIPLPANTWVNIYAHPVIVAAGISAGTQISAQNLGDNRVLVHAGADAPTGSDGYRAISPSSVWSNDSGDSGAWMFSRNVDAIVNVRAQ